MRVRSAHVALVSALLVLLAGCSSAKLPPKDTAYAAYADYVALGDSYSAGPLISPAVKKAPVFCGRSEANYAGLLASYLKVKSLTDATCSAATTADLYSSQSVRMGFPQNSGTKTPPQLDAVTKKTDLVTIGLGGNDYRLFESILVSLAVNGDITKQMKDAVAVEANVAKAIDAIRARAPHARIVVVGYLRVAPADGVCEAFPVSAAAARQADTIEKQINASLAAAAKARKATFIDSYAISAGHDICAGTEAWINGPRNAVFRAAAYHPFRAGMDAVARQIYTTLTSKSATKAPTNAQLQAVNRTQIP